MAKLLKLPMLRLGEWHHAQYQKVKFTQQDFTDLIDNFKKNVRGYEPYLRYGHLLKGHGLKGGEPAQAHLLELYQVNDTLWGIWDPHSDTVVDEVESGKYRYGSVEIVRNAIDKHSGERLSIFLRGHALTNEPFIPNLPRNTILDTQYFSEDESESQFVFMTLSEFEEPMNNCRNCGSKSEALTEANLCKDCASLVNDALASRAKPEYTLLQGMLQAVKQLVGRMEVLPSEITSAVRQENAVLLTEANSTSPTPVVDAPESSNEEPSEPEAQPNASEEDESVEESDSNENVLDQEPSAPADAQPTDALDAPEESDDMEELEQLKADLAAMQAALNQLETEKNTARQQAQEALDILAEKERLEVAAAEEAKEQRFAVALSDSINQACAKGVSPAVAERARALVLAVRPQVEDQAICLSEGEEPVDFIGGIFSLLSEAAAGAVDFRQHGFQPVEGNQSSNIHAERIRKLRESMNK